MVPDGDRVSLRSAIAQFRRAITSKNDDDYAPAQQLYQWLIRPIADILTALTVDNLVFSMGEELRTIPLAALHDGEQFELKTISTRHNNTIGAAS